MRAPLLARAAVAAGLCALASTALAYPEFQSQIARSSGRSVNCALCHAHPDGPDGAGYGQIGRLGAEETDRLNRARKAIEPGTQVQSPILNEFGNSLVRSLGMRRLLELKIAPAGLADALDPASDLDRDGIPDAQELRDGTHPLKKEDGRPWPLFASNFRRNLSAILLTAAATAAGLYGLIHLLRGFASVTRASRDEDEED